MGGSNDAMGSCLKCLQDLSAPLPQNFFQSYEQFLICWEGSTDSKSQPLQDDSLYINVPISPVLERPILKHVLQGSHFQLGMSLVSYIHF